jgi:nitrous oxide reductase accessory protein NosL
MRSMLLVLVVFGCLLTGCSKKEPEEEATPAATTSGTSTSTKPAGGFEPRSGPDPNDPSIPKTVPPAPR